MFTKWNTAYASAKGTSHEKTNIPCQDACKCQVNENEIFFGIASDGAGSASRSEVSSKLVVGMFFDFFCKYVKSETDILLIDKLLVLKWLEEVKAQIFLEAHKESLSPREFACTILGSIVGSENSVFFQIGDGAIVISEYQSTEYGYIFWPQHGEFANQTNFIIQSNLSEVLEFDHLKGFINRIAMFTDGIERLVLDFSEKSVYPPALNSIFEWLQNDLSLKSSESPSSALNAFLNSSFINNRTDDDKSLVMAARIFNEKFNVTHESV